MDKLTLAIPKDLKEAAKRKADAEDTSISRFVRRMLRAWIAGRIPRGDDVELLSLEDKNVVLFGSIVHDRG